MKYIKLFLVLLSLLPTLCTAQYEELFKFNNFEPKFFEYEYSLCPWQSFRLLPNFSFQIDLICDSIAKNVLQADDHLFVDALEYVFRSHPLNMYNVELIRRWDNAPGQYRIHVPGLVAPYNKYFRIERPSIALDITKQGYAGWNYMVHNSGIGIGIKKLSDNTYQVSGALFLRAVNPNTVALMIAQNMFFMSL
jgi:hypothetical protein